jgi:osmotically inducible protein OsmC
MELDLTYSRSAQATWEGSVEDGQGQVTVESGSIGEQPVSLYARINHPKRRQHTTPEELLAAACAVDFSMAFSAALDQAGHSPTRLTTDATGVLERLIEGGFRLKAVKLQVRGVVPDLTGEEFQYYVEEGNRICPLLNALRASIDVSVEGTLDSE